MKNKKRVCKAFFAWADKKEEDWLNEMSLRGWHFQSYFFFFYVFIRGDSKEYVYKLDYNMGLTGNERDNYISLFEDSGWDYLCQFAGWYYFRTEKVGQELPDIYSDNHSKAAKYRRLLKFLSAIFILEIVISVTVVFNPLHPETAANSLLMKGLYGFILILIGYACYRINKRIHALERNEEK